MSYDSTRISEQLRVLEPEIDNFIVRYNASNGPAGGGPAANGVHLSRRNGLTAHAREEAHSTQRPIESGLCL